MDVSDILRDRMHEPSGLQLMAGLSIVVHAIAIGALFVSPPAWYRGRVETPPRVMTITLGGGSGPENGGMTAAGGRPVQAETPPDLKRPEPVRAPAAKTPAMTLPPKPGAATTKKPAPVIKQAPDEARGSTPTRGAETASGSALAQTAARGQGFGLSTAGGAGTGATLDVADFCCPDYLVLMTDRIKSAWNQRQGAAGMVVVRFTIQRDGRLTDSSVERPSGNGALDLAALRSIVVTKQLPPLPAAFPNPTLTVHLNFEYQQQ
ncbi:MAG: TonB family protein [Acidobacteria bacterium]|nr:TonB family protein [Acidobacteriota bacterium]